LFSAQSIGNQQLMKQIAESSTNIFHHKRETFYDEFKRLLSENGIEFDEKYLL